MKLDDSLEEKLEEEKYCPQCWRTMPSDLTYCPFCRAKLEVEPFKRPTLLTMAGLTATTASVISIIAATVNLMAVILTSFALSGGSSMASPWIPLNASIDSSQKELYSKMIMVFLIIAVFDGIGFVLGMTAGTYSWRKRHFKSTIVAITSLSLIGLLNLITLDTPYGFGSFLALFGFPIIILSSLSLIFIVIKQQEFK